MGAYLLRKVLKFAFSETAPGMVFTSDFLQYYSAPHYYIFTQHYYNNHYVK